MSIRSLFKFFRSPDLAFPANRSPQPSSASCLESSALPFPSPPSESDAESSASWNDTFDPFRIDQIFPPATSSVANNSSFSESVSLSFIDPDESGSYGGSEHLNGLTVQKDGPTTNIVARTLSFSELVAATKNFRSEFVFGRGGSGFVYKGHLTSTGQVVAVKKLNRDGLQGNREFLVKVVMLSLLRHPNIVNFIGYCADGDQLLLIYEHMPLGSLQDHLFDLPPDIEPLDWNTRLKIAVGVAKGLEFLHDKANPPVIHRDLRSFKILLGEGYQTKLSNFGLARLGPVGGKTYVSACAMGTYGYCAPEYATSGTFTLKCDVYSFGVVFLELITGRKATDNTRVLEEQNLVAWARPLFQDSRKFPKIVDPMLQGRYPMQGLCEALAVASMCLQEQADARPPIGDVVMALTCLASQSY